MKYILTIKTDDLKSGARVVDAPDRGDLAANLLLTHRKYEFSFECQRTYAGGQALQFTSFDRDVIDDVAGDLVDLEVPHTLDEVPGDLIRVSVLTLLDKGWMLVQPRSGRKLVCTPPNRLIPAPSAGAGCAAFTLNFTNDGTNLWADFDGTAQEIAKLFRAALDSTNTMYDVL